MYPTWQNQKIVCRASWKWFPFGWQKIGRISRLSFYLHGRFIVIQLSSFSWGNLNHLNCPSVVSNKKVYYIKKLYGLSHTLSSEPRFFFAKTSEHSSDWFRKNQFQSPTKTQASSLFHTGIKFTHGKSFGSKYNYKVYLTASDGANNLFHVYSVYVFVTPYKNHA